MLLEIAQEESQEEVAQECFFRRERLDYFAECYDSFPPLLQILYKKMRSRIFEPDGVSGVQSPDQLSESSREYNVRNHLFHLMGTLPSRMDLTVDSAIFYSTYLQILG